MSEPTKLTFEQVLSLAVAGERRDLAVRAGHGVLFPPRPACPSCQQPVTELAIREDYSFHLDLVHFAAKPCGHRFTADGGDVHEAVHRTREIVSSSPINKENEA